METMNNNKTNRLSGMWATELEQSKMNDKEELNSPYEDTGQVCSFITGHYNYLDIPNGNIHRSDQP